MTGRRTPGPLIVLLASLTSLGPLSISFYLPALPSLVDEFGATEGQVQLTMTATLVGLAVGQIVIGTLSDSVGRRTPLVWGLVGYSATSFAITAVDNIALLVALRALQGFFGCAGIVLSRAVVRDTSSGPFVGRVNARLLLVITVTPLVAPGLGAQVLTLGSWRLMFLILGAISAVFVAIVAIALPETLAVGERRRGGVGPAMSSYGGLLRDRRLRLLVTVIGLVMMSYFAYLTASAFVFTETFGLTTQQFGLLFGAGAVMMTIGSQLGGSLFGRTRPESVVATAFVVALAGTVSMILLSLGRTAGSSGLVPFLVALLPALCATGVLLSTVQGIVLAESRSEAGSRAALLGAAQFGLGALGAPLSGFFGSTALAMAGVMATALLIGAATFARARVR